MELQKTANFQSNLEKKGTKLEIQPRFHHILQYSSIQKCGMGAKTDKQINEQNEESKNKPTHLNSFNQ